MTNPLRPTLLANAILAILLGGGILFAAHGWLGEHDARLKTGTQTGQQQRQIDGLKEQQAGIQQALDRKLAGMERERRRPATAAQVVRGASTSSPDLPEPLQIRSAPINPALPNTPPAQEIVIPEADFKSIRDAQLTCREDAAKLTACQATEQDKTRQLQLVESQRDEWKAVARGGSFWHRTLGAAKWFAVGAGTGAVAYAVTHRK